MSPPILPAISLAITLTSKQKLAATHLSHRLCGRGRVRCQVGLVISSHQAQTATLLHSLGQGLLAKAVLSFAGRSEANLEGRHLNNSISAFARSQDSNLVCLDATCCTPSMLSTTKLPTFQSGMPQKEDSRTIP